MINVVKLELLLEEFPRDWNVYLQDGTPLGSLMVESTIDGEDVTHNVYLIGEED